MSLATFVHHINQSESSHEQAVICLQYVLHEPILFKSYVAQALSRSTGLKRERINWEHQSLEHVYARLQMLFLGNYQLYVLESTQDLTANQIKTLTAYLRSYRGPHTILLSCSQPIEGALNIVCDESDEAFFKALYAAIEGKECPKQVIRELFARPMRMTVDQAYMAVRGLALTGNNTTFIHELCAPDQSLFTLSQYFFARNLTSFFAYWKECYSKYTPAFWNIFWSEQFWRAALVVKLLDQENVSHARKAAYRLPFSFVTRDWKMWQTPELIKAHANLYLLDHYAKHGGDGVWLDLIFARLLIER